MKFSSGPDLSLQVENRQLRDENEKLKNEIQALLAKIDKQPFRIRSQKCYMKVEDKTGIRVTYCMLDKGHKGKCQ